MLRKSFYIIALDTLFGPPRILDPLFWVHDNVYSMNMRVYNYYVENVYTR